MQHSDRKIPYNYTSADDEQIINRLFGTSFYESVLELGSNAESGRILRRLFRFFGDMFIIERNPFLFQELVDHPRLKQYLVSQFKNDLTAVEHSGHIEAVLPIIRECRAKLNGLLKSIHTFKECNRKIRHQLAPVIGRNNIYFDAFNICAHATDATDWRMHMPRAVLRPENEDQVPGLVKKIKQLGLHIIPRGAGTGLTGGATPLASTCMMLNTEKINVISDIDIHIDHKGREVASIHLGAGVITQDAIDTADRQGYIFATDPTSAWACTIGGNISENAGGKKAVLFGTAIDNILSYSIVLPDCRTYTIRRYHHPLRKIEDNDHVRFDIYDDEDQPIQTIVLHSSEIRKKGLGKDITNKALKGLPGLQKEGCDGIITSARFILYPKLKYKKTVCIEFFGSDMTQASQVITRITKEYSNRKPALMALEHFDEAYIKAIEYKTKTTIGNRVIAVVLADLVSNDEACLNEGLSRLETLLESFDKTGFKTAEDAAESDRFWQDRKRLGAIAKHTKAFKLNEDIVLPIDSLADFASWADQTNIEEKKINQEQIIDNIITYLDEAIPLADPQWLIKRVGQAKNLAFSIKNKMPIASRDAIEAYIHAKNFFDAVVKSLHGYTLVIENVSRIYEQTKSRLIVIATHMHAGDGNVHVNIPVLSNDREMMSRAAMVADKVMEKAVEFKGVVSGEHGIGVTKIKHLDSNTLNKFSQYRHLVDPEGIMNPGKLSDSKILDKVFTPSFNLMDIEAKILEHTSLSELSEKVSNCVRCGKCKITCPVFYPGENLFYHPRNKNIGMGSLIEALLYISQRTQSTAFKILKHIEQIADHCTLCHKCFLKCPVQIDTADISVFERKLLKDYGLKQVSHGTETSLKYLNSSQPFINKAFRTGFLKTGSFIQRAVSRAVPHKKKNSRANHPSVIDMFRTPVTLPHRKPLSAFLPKTLKNQAVIIEPSSEVVKTVFYFPGCGSERLFSRISMAALVLLLGNRIRVVLPPANLCCGYPFKVNAKIKQYENIQLENLIVFSQIQSMFQDFSFDACIVSCGTCMEALNTLGLATFFNCEIKDISEYVFQQNDDIDIDHDCLYHAPCHDSLKEQGLHLLQSFSKDCQVRATSHCCSEAGTMAISKPHISYAMHRRKQADINKVRQGRDYTIVTNCPSCIQGLGRLDKGRIPVRHFTEELAAARYGKNWMKTFKTGIANAKVVSF